MTPDLTHGLHSVGDDAADLRIVGGDGGHLGDLVFAGDLAGHAVQLLHHRFDALFDAALEGHGVGARGDHLEPLFDEGMGENGSGGGAVTGNVVGFRGHFLHELSAHVLEGVLVLLLFGNGHAVVDDIGRAEFLFNPDVAAAGTQGHPHHIRQLLHARENLSPCLFPVDDLFRCHTHLLTPR